MGSEQVAMEVDNVDSGGEDSNELNASTSSNNQNNQSVNTINLSDDEDDVDNSSGIRSNNKTPPAIGLLKAFNLSTPPSSTSGGTKRKKLTPDERNAREKERNEKRAKLDAERIRKDEEKAERARIKEEERLKKEEEKRQKDEEKRRKEEERQKLQSQKDAEKQKKEEEKRAKEAEKQKREDEKKAKEAEKQRALDKQRNLLSKFFIKTPTTSKPAKTYNVETPVLALSPPRPKQTDLESNKENDEIVCLSDSEDVDMKPSTSKSSKSSRTSSTTTTPKRSDTKGAKLFQVMPFQVKTDMAIAPIVRREHLTLDERTILEDVMDDSVGCKQEPDYLQALKMIKGRRSSRTIVTYDTEVVIGPKVLMTASKAKKSGLIRWRIKLLQFHDNRRPAYWGTCKKSTNFVGPRKPFAHDKELNYDYESDDDWDDEPEDGEDLDASDKEEDADDDGDAEEEAEGWVVPHGYLSDSEGDNEGHLDKESMKKNEKEYFKTLSQQIRMGLPIILTDDLSEYTMILYSTPVTKLRRTTRKIPTVLSKDTMLPARGQLGQDLNDDSDEDDDDFLVDDEELNSFSADESSTDSEDEMK